MYPRNSATPPTIVVGTIYLNADGTIQTSGVLVSVSVGESAEVAGGGTTTYGASFGAVYYKPTQAETDAESFKVAAYKAACTSASVTVLTDSNTPHIRYAGSHGPGIYIETSAANTSTVFGVDGTYDNPVSTLAAATTLAASLGCDRIYYLGTAQITLAQNYTDWEFIGSHGKTASATADIDLGNQILADALFVNLQVTGQQGTGGRLTAENSIIKNVTGLNGTLQGCRLKDATTIATSGDVVIADCIQADDTTPTISFPAGPASSCYIQGYNGRVDILTMTSASDLLFVGNGQLTINGTGGTALISSDVLLTDLSGGAITVTRGLVMTLGEDGVELSLTQPVGWPRTFQEFHEAVLTPTVDDATFAPTVDTFETDQTDNDPAEWTDQALFWTSGANEGSTVFVTAYDYQNGKVKLTVSTMQTAPSNGDKFQRAGRSNI